MAHTLTHKGFEPAETVEHATRPRTSGKRWLAISWALRPCGVSVFEAQESLAGRGGEAYSYSYTRSAQYARSEYAPLGYGVFGQAETVGEHIAAVRAHGGDEAAEYTRACMPDSHGDDDKLLVLYAWAAGGIAYGSAGAYVDGLPASADDAAQRREALTAQPKGKGGKRGKGKGKGAQAQPAQAEPDSGNAGESDAS